MQHSHHHPRKRITTILGAALPVCQLCQASLASRQAVTLRETESAQLIHVCCPRCRGNFVLLLLMHELGMGSISLLTDLSDEDARRFSDSKPVSVDDILDVHRLLRNSTVTATI